jgi:hypothetical protein
MSSPQYDIETLLEGNDGPAKLLFCLRETLSPHDRNELFQEEKVILDAWTFDSSFGNGINDLLVNENYDTIANGFSAMRRLELPRLNEFVSALESVFASFSISCASGDDIAKVEGLPVPQQQRLKLGLEEAERPYLKDFWESCILILAAKDYLMSNLAAFKRRQ